jgi:hypothetical protein
MASLKNHALEHRGQRQQRSQTSEQLANDGITRYELHSLCVFCQRASHIAISEQSSEF